MSHMKSSILRLLAGIPNIENFVWDALHHYELFPNNEKNNSSRIKCLGNKLMRHLCRTFDSGLYGVSGEYDPVVSAKIFSLPLQGKRLQMSKIIPHFNSCLVLHRCIVNGTHSL